MTDNATAAAVPGGLFSEQIHVMVDIELRAYTLGLAVEHAAANHYGVLREGARVRDLLVEAIDRRRKRDGSAYAETMRKGREELARRSAVAERNRQRRGQEIAEAARG